MSEENTQTEELESTQTQDNTGIGETGQDAPREDSDAQQTDSQEQDWEHRYRNLEKKLSEQGAELGQYRQAAETWDSERTQYKEALKALTGHVEAQTDPEVAAWNDYERVRQDYGSTPEQERAALQRALQARDQKNINTLRQQVMHDFRIQSEMPEAARLLGVKDTNEAARRLAGMGTLSPKEAAYVMKLREGKLHEVVANERKAEEERAQHAELLKSIGMGGGRSVPGSTQEQDAPAPTVESWNFDMWSKARRKEWLEGGGRVIDQFGEDVTEQST